MLSPNENRLLFLDPETADQMVDKILDSEEKEATEEFVCLLLGLRETVSKSVF